MILGKVESVILLDRDEYMTLGFSGTEAMTLFGGYTSALAALVQTKSNCAICWVYQVTQTLLTQ